MAPKSLLRHPSAVSTVSSVASDTFQPVLPASADGEVECHVICSGKVYYDLMAALDSNGSRDIAVTRLEQFYPYPETQMRAELERYASASHVVWMQEEPKNMGGWTFVSPWLQRLLNEARGNAGTELTYVGRPPSASTATGSASLHAEMQEDLVKRVLSFASAVASN